MKWSHDFKLSLPPFLLALQLLHQFSSGLIAPLTGIWATVDYLQNLGANQIDLILEYSKWIIKVIEGVC